MGTFINFSNHSSDGWNSCQIKAANRYGDIVDIPFPDVNPNASKEDIRKITEECLVLITKSDPEIVLCQGEFTLCFSVVSELKVLNIPCVAACSKRRVAETKNLDGSITKTTVFEFVGFREY